MKPYGELPITTMTMIISLTGGVNVRDAFQLLQITRITISRMRETSKCKLPHCVIPGSILSVRYKEGVRGIIKNNSGPFKNAVTVDISTLKKNISLKLSTLSIQMCGASSKEDGIEAATHIINHLKNIQRLMNEMKRDIDHTNMILDWISQETKGPEIDVVDVSFEKVGNVLLKIENPRKDNLVIKPQKLIPEHFNKKIAMFLLSFSNEFHYHSQFNKKIRFIPKARTLVDENLAIESVDQAMVNNNYKLGFQVDRTALNAFINGKNGFISRYNNALTTCVSIELPYKPLASTTIKRKKTKVPHHTFLVYKSGSVTQSGPGGILMENAYYLFIDTIKELMPYIIYKNDQEQSEQSEHQEQSVQFESGETCLMK